MLLTKRNSLFDDFLNDPFLNDGFLNRRAVMKTDIEDDGTNYRIETELPGYSKEQIRADLKDGYLTILANSATESEDSNSKKYIHKERYNGSIKRSFYVGTGLRQEDIKASFEQGILKLTVPKEAPKQNEEIHSIPIE
ncbi:Hsp20/alpha crystallin family protein [Clostridium sp. E02]|uniref:Hsp20/alpha crystallin family protein n=1 Tax=Clostridium sp. E02 TaxID=2487134 RepID=UPI000F51F443|nr:Hsp20/alpha crystallin family protein [Clostridium sp. E02]